MNDLLRIAHYLPRPIAYVLGGGGSRGAIQLGMLQALAETDIRPDLVIGTSVGSLNGAIVAADPDNAAATLGQIWPRIDRKEVFPGGFVSRIIQATSTKRPYVFDPTPLSELLLEYLPVRTIEQLAIPYVAIATDLDTGMRVDMDSGDLPSAMLASSAIPVAFPWVEREGHRLVDGGLVANIPVKQAAERGAGSIIVLDCGIFGAEGKWAEGIMGVIVQSLAIVGRQQITADLEVAASMPVIYLPLPPTIATTVFDFENTDTMSEHAYAHTGRWLGELAARECTPDEILPPGLYGEPPMAILNPAVEALRRA